MAFMLLLLFVLNGKLSTRCKDIKKSCIYYKPQTSWMDVTVKDDFAFQELMVLASLGAEKRPHTHAPTWPHCSCEVA